VKSGVLSHETGFIAEKSLKDGPGPVIAFMAEYDALAGLGHGCGHNIIASASIAAALAVANVAQAEAAGSVLCIGCPAEEGGVPNPSAKGTYARGGIFDGVDVAMQIHPGAYNSRTVPHLAIDSWSVEFFGKAAHAAGAPDEGINALDAMILLFNSVGLMRQQLREDAKIHGIIVKGGDAPNIIPDHTLAKFYVRAFDNGYLAEMNRRFEDSVKGAALAAGCTYKAVLDAPTIESFLLSPEIDAVYALAAEELGMPFEEPEHGTGSSDVGNVTQLIPTIQPYLKIGGAGLIAHTPEFRDAAVTPEADEALLLGAKALAITALRLYKNPETVEAAKQAHKERKAASSQT